MNHQSEMERIGAGYDRIAELIYEDPELYEDSLALVDSMEGSVLDVGCGQGHFLALVRERFPAVQRLAGCDISPRLCEIARGAVPTADIRVCDGERLDGYGDAEFDVVSLITSLSNMRDHAAALRAAYRVLKPGGALLVVVPNRMWLRYDTWLAHHRQLQPVDDHFFRPDELRALCEAAGFRIERVRGVWAIFRAGWMHRLERLGARLFPPLHRRMKEIGFRCRKPTDDR